MTKLLLIRHGESQANRQAVFAGQSDPPLTDTGRLQAELTANFIAEHYQVDCVYASDLQRAYATGLCLARRLEIPIIKDTGLREIFAGRWEKMKFAEIEVTYPVQYETWRNHIGDARCVGGESVWELADRVMATLARIACDNVGKTVAIATHATPVRAIQSLVQTGTVAQMEQIPWVSNASVTELTYVDGIWKLGAVSQDAHLVNAQTHLPANV